ncbi:MAG: hypothetical protein QME28_07020 [Candidatus Saccharicenans sp.]|nr:hypothetical protein [Candidatus Saccharicenans sp.]
MLWWLNSALGTLIRIIFMPLASFHPWIAMLVISLLTALLMLFVYKKTSDQAGIKRARERIKAHLLEIRLYQNDFRTQLNSQKELLAANLRYLSYNLKPLLVMIIPIFLLLAQLNLWFSYRIPAKDETFLLKARFIKSVDLMKLNLEVETPAGLQLETPPVRIIDEAEVSWRLRVTGATGKPVIITVDGERYLKSIPATNRSLTRVSPVRVRKNLWQELLHPGEKPLPADSLLTRVELVLPESRLEFAGISFHWLVAYFLLSIIFGFALKGVFRVEI